MVDQEALERTQWYVYTSAFGEGEAEKVGPIGFPMLRVAIHNNILHESDYFWRDGYDDWVAGGQCPALEELFERQTRYGVVEPDLGASDSDVDVETITTSETDESPDQNRPELKTEPHAFGVWVNFPEQWLEEYAEPPEEVPG